MSLRHKYGRVHNGFGLVHKNGPIVDPRVLARTAGGGSPLCDTRLETPNQ